ncbi:MAG TPA: glycosyltransferase [Planctomycetota bacterium]|nr:glycosyltransferase [Planctomycetota bacterium]
MPPDEETPKSEEPQDEPEGKSWELLDDEFTPDGEERGGRRRRRERFERGRRDVEELGAGTSGIDVLEQPREGVERRRRSVEPGLTLRDLMPFLRPPRHVVVCGAGTGAGHARIAHALAELLKAAERNLLLREVDCLDLLSPEYRPGYVRAVLEELARRPALYGAPFETGSPSAADRLPEDLDPFLGEIFADKLRQTLIDKRPDVVVLTHWLPLRRLEAEAAHGATLPKIVVVAGDVDYHPLWWSPVVKSWFVPNADFERRLAEAGAPPGSVHVVGTPVSPSFSEEVDREAVRRAEGLRRDAPTVLFRPGGVGANDRVAHLVRRLLAGGAPVNLLVVAGKNDRLVEELSALETPEGSVLKAYGFTEKIHELMAVSDLLVTRAAPHTAAEAASVGLPLLLLRPTPGAEERLADRLLASGVALVARDDEQFLSELGDLLKNRRRLGALRDRARQAERPDSAQRTAEKLLKVVR